MSFLEIQAERRQKSISVEFSFATVFAFKHHVCAAKKKLLNIKRVFWFSLQLFFSETFLILRRSQRDTVANVHTLLCKASAILFGFNETSIFSTDFRKKKLKCQISWNIRPVGSWVVPCGQTDRHDKTDNCFFRNFVNAPKKEEQTRIKQLNSPYIVPMNITYNE